MSSDINYLHEKIAHVRLYEVVALIFAVVGVIAVVSGCLLIAIDRGEFLATSKIGGMTILVGNVLLLEGSLFAARFSEQKLEYMKKMKETTEQTVHST